MCCSFLFIHVFCSFIFPSPFKPAALLAWNHYEAFSFFGNHYYSLSEIMAYFTLFLWLVPFALLVSLSANDNVLPSYATSGETHPLLCEYLLIRQWIDASIDISLNILPARHPELFVLTTLFSYFSLCLGFFRFAHYLLNSAKIFVFFSERS